MDNSAVTIQEIPVVGTGPVGQGAKEGLEAQEAQEAQNVEDVSKGEKSVYSGDGRRKAVTTWVFKLYTTKRSLHQVLAFISGLTQTVYKKVVSLCG